MTNKQKISELNNLFTAFATLAALKVFFLSLEAGENSKAKMSKNKTDLPQKNSRNLFSSNEIRKNIADDVIKFHSHTHKTKKVAKIVEEGVWRCICELTRSREVFRPFCKIPLALVFFLFFKLMFYEKYFQFKWVKEIKRLKTDIAVHGNAHKLNLEKIVFKKKKISLWWRGWKMRWRTDARCKK